MPREGLLWADDPLGEWAQWTAGDPVPAGYAVWSSTESGTTYVGLPVAAAEWDRNMASTRPDATLAQVRALCARVLDRHDIGADREETVLLLLTLAADVRDLDSSLTLG